MKSIDEQTIADFGEQWTRFRDNSGFYGSQELFADAFGALLSFEEIRGKRVLDIGSGTGRIVSMLLRAGAREVVAVEPSAAFDVLVENTRADASRIRYLRTTGDDLPADLKVDIAVTFGVLHHIHDPRPVVDAAFRALERGGKMVAWLYGWEGNESYLRVAEPLRKVTTRLPHTALDAVSRMLNLGVDIYLPIARRVPVPLAGYMNNVFSKLTRDRRREVIYDQLNPAYAKYYRREEAYQLLHRSGFVDVKLHHRHGYSWTVSGIKP